VYVNITPPGLEPDQAIISAGTGVAT